MKRRDFIAFVAGVPAWLLPWPRLASAQNPAPQNPAPQNSPPPNPPAENPASQTPAVDNAAAAEQIGQVATLQGSATVIRAKAAAAALQVNAPIFLHDTIETAANSTLGVTFDDQTTFSLSANTRIVVDEFVYQEGAAGNAAAFNVAAGGAAFVASLVAKTGTLRISTPVATMGIRGTTGVVEVPQSGGTEEPKAKLYKDPDGHLGRIEVFNVQGVRVGILAAEASAFLLLQAADGRLAAVPYQIPPEEAARDRRVLRRLFESHRIGRRLTRERLRLRGRPGVRGPHEPHRQHEQPRSNHPTSHGRNPPPKGPPGPRRPYER